MGTWNELNTTAHMYTLIILYQDEHKLNISQTNL